MSAAPTDAPDRLARGSAVGIIGAGIAGLCTAKVLAQFGFEVTVIEKEAELGGVWAASRRYPGLTTQNPRSTYEFSDFPMPRDYPEWPSGEQVQAYLEAYAKRFRIRDRIVFGAEVCETVLDASGKRWTVWFREVAGGAAEKPQARSFDWLVVCNGIFSEPFIPAFPGSEAFLAAGGRICHTSEFTRLEDVRDRNVVVIGYGKSSCDVASATVGVSRNTSVVARHLIWKIPRKLKGVVNFKYLFLTRMGEALFPWIRLRGFEAFLHGRGVRVRNFMLRRVENVVAAQLRLRELGLHPGTPLETIARSTVSLVTDGFYENVRAGRLAVEIGEVAGLQAGQARLSNGANVPADVIVCGTGWRQRTPFFSPEVAAKLTDERGNYRLYRSMIPVGVPRLAFNGYNSSFFSQLNAEIGALWIVGRMLNAFPLPPAEAMNEVIDMRLAWMERRTDGKHSKGTNIIPFSLHHMDELLADLELPLGRFRRFGQWLMPVTGPDFRPLTGRLLKRYRDAGRRSPAAVANDSTPKESNT